MLLDWRSSKLSAAWEMKSFVKDNRNILHQHFKNIGMLQKHLIDSSFSPPSLHMRALVCTRALAHIHTHICGGAQKNFLSDSQIPNELTDLTNSSLQKIQNKSIFFKDCTVSPCTLVRERYVLIDNIHESILLRNTGFGTLNARTDLEGQRPINLAYSVSSLLGLFCCSSVFAVVVVVFPEVPLADLDMPCVLYRHQWDRS